MKKLNLNDIVGHSIVSIKTNLMLATEDSEKFEYTKKWEWITEARVELETTFRIACVLRCNSKMVKFAKTEAIKMFIKEMFQTFPENKINEQVQKNWTEEATRTINSMFSVYSEYKA